MMTSFEATSREAILPSGEMRDLVMPGMLRVVALGRTRGVEEPEFCRTGGLSGVSQHRERARATYIRGLCGAVVDVGVSLAARARRGISQADMEPVKVLAKEEMPTGERLSR